MPLDASIGTTTANSYCTVDEATAYFAERIDGDNWNNVSQPDAFLISASRLLDWNFQFIGRRTTPDQSMEFPRKGLIMPGYTPPEMVALFSGYEVLIDVEPYMIPDNVIPNRVKMAVFELAFSSISLDRTADGPLDGIDQIKAGPIYIRASPGGYTNTKPKLIPQYIRQMLNDFIDVGSIGVVRLVRT